MKRLSKRGKKGVVMLIFASLALFILLPAVGLAIDLGIAFAARARLQSAADGAVLAATRALGRGLDQASRQAEAKTTAEKFFAANVGKGWMGLGSSSVNVTFPAAPPKTTVVKIDTLATLPTYFMRVLGKKDMALRSMSAASRRDVNIMLVIDRSGSLAQSGSCAALREAVKSFVVTFQEGRDKVGMVTYATSYTLDHPLSSNFRTGANDVSTKADAIKCDGWTNSSSGYSLAYEQLKAAAEPGALNAILFFTDGQPNSVTMPRLRMKAGGTCESKGNRFGVITENGGIYDPTPGKSKPESSLIGKSSKCKFSDRPTLANVADDAVGLTRSAADGNSGADDGDNGNITGLATDALSLLELGGHKWDNWPIDQDAFGNSLFGYKGVSKDGSGRIRLESDSVRNAGVNALANAATRVRADSIKSGLDVVTYVIGLGNFKGAPEMELLHRVANTPASPTHDSSKPVGLMIFASEAGQLEAAFAQISSEMLRLSM